MVIDIHRHFWRGNQRYYDAQAAAEAPAPEKPDWETTAQEHAAEMEASGVDASALLVADYGDRLGTPHFTIDQENWILAEAAKRHPQRIVAFYGIDPRRPGAPEKFERAIEEWGMGGIKLHAYRRLLPPRPGLLPDLRDLHQARRARAAPLRRALPPAAVQPFHPSRWSSTRWPLTSRA